MKNKGLISILPAHAGMIPKMSTTTLLTQDITRTCGDDPQVKCLPRHFQLILPAHAGMILRFQLTKDNLGYITRTCGDDPATRHCIS